MSKLKYKIGEVRGIPLKVTAAWFVIATLLTIEFTRGIYQEEINMITGILPGVEMTFESLPTELKLVFGTTFIGSIYGSVLLHEFGHAIRAEANNITVEEIRLWILGGVANVDMTNTTAKEEFDIAASGPLVTLGIVAVTGSITGILVLVRVPSIVVVWFGLLTLINAAIFGFNMLPMFPLDGGRILRSAIQYWHGNITATKMIKKISLLMSIGLSIYAITTMKLFYLLIAGFIFLSSNAEIKKAMREKREEEIEVMIAKIISRIRNEKYPITVANTTTYTIEDTPPVFTVTGEMSERVTFTDGDPDIVVTDDDEKVVSDTDYATINTMTKEEYDELIKALKNSGEMPKNNSTVRSRKQSHTETRQWYYPNEH